MYMYPDNLKGKATLWLWYLRDIGIVGVGGNHWSDCHFSCQFLYANGISRVLCFFNYPYG